MPSKAERQRARKSRAVALAAQRYSERTPAGAALSPAAPKAAIARARRPTGQFDHQPRMDGIDLLQGRGRITPAQARALREYGALYRASVMEGGVSIPSAIDPSRTGGGGGAAMALNSASHWIAESRIRLEGARAALGYHSALIAVVDLICGQGLRPREISAVQREAEQIETSLRLAADMLEDFFVDEARMREGRGV